MPKNTINPNLWFNAVRLANNLHQLPPFFAIGSVGDPIKLYSCLSRSLAFLACHVLGCAELSKFGNQYNQPSFEECHSIFWGALFVLNCPIIHLGRSR